MGEFPHHFDVFREAIFSCENAGGMAAGPRGPHLCFPYLSRVGPDFENHHNAGRSCKNNGRYRKNTSSIRKVVRELRSQAEVII